MRNIVLVASWFVGVALIAAGVLMGWMEISYVFTDGTGQTISATGIGLFTDFSGSGVPVSSAVPVAYLMVAVFAAFLGAAFATGRPVRAGTYTGVMLALAAIMMVLGVTCVDSAMYSNLSGTYLSAVPDWLTGLVSGDIATARVSSGLGYAVSCAGALVCTAAALAGEVMDRKGAEDPSSAPEAAARACGSGPARGASRPPRNA